MPSFINHSRTYTWPPSLHLLDLTNGSSSPGSPKEPLPDIDDDPFAHFITPMTEEDNPFDDFIFNAGIVVGEPTASVSKTHKFKQTVAKKWVRYVARNHEQLHRLYHRVPVARKAPKIIEPTQLPTVQNEIQRPYKTEIREPTRGRAQDLLNPRHNKRRRTSRTLSGHRHSWREPSVDLFTVMEEGEATSRENESINKRSYSDSDLSERAKL
jgi:hypothetical protein